MPMSIGVPVKLLHESEGHIVTVEMTSGEVYRGLMVDAEDNMNCQMQNVTVTSREGKPSKMEHVYIRCVLKTHTSLIPFPFSTISPLEYPPFSLQGLESSVHDSP